MHPPPPKRNNRKGFTLSETLIAVAILGLLAAIVIPNMFKAYQQYQMVSKLKVAYALLNDVVAQAEIYEGPISTWNMMDSHTDTFNKYFRPYLAISKDCGVYSGSDNSKWCFNGNSVGGWNSLGSTNNSGYYYPNNYYKVKLKNGMALGVSNANKIEVSMRPHRFNVIVDIDGDKGKSIAGKDVFFFTISNGQLNGGNAYLPAGVYTGMIQQYTYNTINNYHWGTKYLDWMLNYDCTKNTANYEADGNRKLRSIQGGLCARVIELNGWKVPKDYPW